MIRGAEQARFLAARQQPYTYGYCLCEVRIMFTESVFRWIERVYSVGGRLIVVWCVADSGITSSNLDDGGGVYIIRNLFPEGGGSRTPHIKKTRRPDSLAFSGWRCAPHHVRKVSSHSTDNVYEKCIYVVDALY